MTAIKEKSTIQENKKIALQLCPVTYVMEKISGYWKPIIIYQLSTGSKRYSELRRAIPAVTEKVLIQHLKQLERDGLVIRESKPVVPPFVTYSCSESALRLVPMIHAMVEWALEEMEKSNLEKQD
jgi:DNA-binding HxlR family transcriptional regulator